MLPVSLHQSLLLFFLVPPIRTMWWPFKEANPPPARFPMDLMLPPCKNPDEPRVNLWDDIIAGKAVMIGFWFGDCDTCFYQAMAVDHMVHYYPELEQNLQVIGINSMLKRTICHYPELSFPMMQDDVNDMFEDAFSVFNCQKDDFVLYTREGNLVRRISHAQDNMTDFQAAGNVHDAAFEAVGLPPPSAEKNEYGYEKINALKEERKKKKSIYW